MPRERKEVASYSDDGKGGYYKVFSEDSQGLHFYLESQVRRFVERNTYGSKITQDQKVMLCELAPEVGGNRTIWREISARYVGKFKQELLAY